MARQRGVQLAGHPPTLPPALPSQLSGGACQSRSLELPPPANPPRFRSVGTLRHTVMSLRQLQIQSKSRAAQFFTSIPATRAGCRGRFQGPASESRAVRGPIVVVLGPPALGNAPRPPVTCAWGPGDALRAASPSVPVGVRRRQARGGGRAGSGEAGGLSQSRKNGEGVAGLSGVQASSNPRPDLELWRCLFLKKACQQLAAKHRSLDPEPCYPGTGKPGRRCTLTISTGARDAEADVKSVPVDKSPAAPGGAAGLRVRPVCLIMMAWRRHRRPRRPGQE